MFAAIMALISLVSGGVNKWVEYKQQQIALTQQIQLETLKAQAALATATAQSDASQLSDRLNSTSRGFKQATFWLICFPIIFSIVCPKYAAVMWTNLNAVPEYWQWLFRAVISAIWGLPLLRGGWNIATDFIQGRRDYKVEKIKALNEARIFESLRKSIFTKGLTEGQVKAVQEAIRQGQE